MDGWDPSFSHLIEKRIPRACLLWSGLNNIFHWIIQLLTTFRSLLNSTAEQFLLTFENSDMSPAKTLQIDLTPSGKSLCKLGIKWDPKRSLVKHFSREKISLWKLIKVVDNRFWIRMQHQWLCYIFVMSLPYT